MIPFVTCEHCPGAGSRVPETDYPRHVEACHPQVVSAEAVAVVCFPPTKHEARRTATAPLPADEERAHGDTPAHTRSALLAPLGGSS